MKTLFVLFYLLSLSGAIAVLFKRQIEETIVGVLFSIIIIIYITGLFCGTLLCGFYLCIFAGGTSFLYLGWSLSKDWRMVKNHCITPGLVIFIALFAWI